MACALGFLLSLVLLASGLTTAQTASVARISALSNGALMLNGKPTDLSTLDTEFRRLKQVQGAVWYHRENAHAEPPAQAMAVVQLIIRHQLPVSMSTKADFSDYVDANGQSRPRTP